ncbi:MAG: acyl-CoA dehydrogenase, partial [Mycolicibacterium sp.]|nr:acyl-CoA dehydrogenase [Mycolicibacterium sp.]
MTNTLPTNGAAKRPTKTNGRDSAVGFRKHKRTPIDIGLALVTPLVGQEFLDKYHLRDPLNRALRYGVKTTFSVAGAGTRQFKRV